MKICILIPHNYPTFHTDFTVSLVSMIMGFYQWRDEMKRDDTISWIKIGGFAIDKMRNALVKRALEDKEGFTHLLFLDTDMVFPIDTIPKMIMDFEDNKDQKIDCIAGLYTWKKPPFTPHVYLELNKKTEAFRVAGQFPLDRLFEIKATGAGCMMITTDFLKKCKKPVFRFTDKIGEDFYFFKKHQPKSLLDPTIKCGHLKQVAVSIDNYIDYNGFERVGKNFKINKNLDKIAEMHKKNQK